MTQDTPISTLTFLESVSPYVRADGARNLYKISKELSIPYETLRFRMMNLKEQGITILPMVDLGKIGLRRRRVSFELDQHFDDLQPFFAGLHQKAGLTYYSSYLFSRTFDCEFAVPQDADGELNRLLRSLNETGLVSDYASRAIVSKEILMMNAKYYDYQQRQWSVDFSMLSGDPSFHEAEVADSAEGGQTKAKKERVDFLDLLIIKELQLDPWIKTVELSRKFGVSDRHVAYHLNRHVFGHKFVPSFRFRWVGTRDTWLNHAISPIEIVFNGLSESATRYAMSVLTALPFTWNEMRTDDQLICQLMIPVAHMPEALRYMSENLSRLGIVEPTIHFVDWQRTCSYTVPYLIYEKGVGWKFNAEESLAYLQQMIQTYSKN